MESCSIHIVERSFQGFSGDELILLARELKNSRNGVLVGSQGYISVFHVSSTVEKKKPFGLLMRSGELREIMIPAADEVI